MKAVFLLAVLTVFILLPEECESWFFRRIKEKVKKKFGEWKHKVKNWWRNFKAGRRDVDSLDDLDLNQDGAIDQSELEAVVGERHARDLWQFMEAGDSLSFDEFERNARELDELEGEDE